MLSSTIRNRSKARNVNFIGNGSVLLEKQIAFCNGKCNPIVNFTAKELKKATKSYSKEQVIWEASAKDYKMYKGHIQGRPVLIKKFSHLFRGQRFVINDIVISTQMNTHNNVLKLLGCCLETSIPTLVFEYVENGTLADRCADSSQKTPVLSWENRLRIAVDIANTVTYLHTAFSKPVIYRNINPLNIFLNEKNIPKLFDFSYAVCIPEGESKVEDSVGWAVGLVAPEFLATGYLTEKTDSFSFGFFLLVLLTGRCSFGLNRGSSIHGHITLYDLVKYHVEKNSLSEIVDPTILEEVGGTADQGRQLQLLSLIELAFRCLSKVAEDRPTITEAAKQLRLIKGSKTQQIFSSNTLRVAADC